MTSVAFPSVIAAVMTVASAATSEEVVRGLDISDDPSSVVMIGIQSLDDPRNTAGTWDQEFQTFGGGLHETGKVNGLVQAWNGDSDQGAATVTAFAIFTDIAAAVRADNTLGITGFDYIVARMESGEVIESNDSEGASTVLPFSIHYDARLA